MRSESRELGAWNKDGFFSTSKHVVQMLPDAQNFTSPSGQDQENASKISPKMVTMFSDAEMKHFAFQARSKAERTLAYSKGSGIAEFWDRLKQNLTPDHKLSEDYFLFNQVELFLRKLLPITDHQLCECPEMVELWLLYLEMVTPDTKLHLLYFLLDQEIGANQPIFYYHIIRCHLEAKEYVIADEWIRDVAKRFPQEQEGPRLHEALQHLTQRVDEELKQIADGEALYCENNWNLDLSGIPKELFDYIFTQPIARKKSELLRYPLEVPKQSKPPWFLNKANSGQVDFKPQNHKEDSRGSFLMKAASQPMSSIGSFQAKANQQSLSPLSALFKAQQTEMKKLRNESPLPFKRLSDSCEVDFQGNTRIFVDRQNRLDVFGPRTLKTRELEYRRALVGVITLDIVRESQVVQKPNRFDFFKEREYREQTHNTVCRRPILSINRVLPPTSLSQTKSPYENQPQDTPSIVPETTVKPKSAASNSGLDATSPENSDLGYFSLRKVAKGTNGKHIAMVSPRLAQLTPLSNRLPCTPESSSLHHLTPTKLNFWRP